MSAQTAVRPVATPEDQSVLAALMAPTEAPISDAPLFSPQAAGVALLLGLLLLSPQTPAEPKKG